MAKTFSLITEKQGEKLAENVYLDDNEMFFELGALAGEIALRCAQTSKNYRLRPRLEESLGNMLALIQLYAATNEGAWQNIISHGEQAMQRIRTQTEENNHPSLILDEAHEDYGQIW